jgi:pimeloyl-ACP methyl ester carboxylesterase
MTPDINAQTRTTEGRVIVNGAELYYEVRGTGPAVLLIHGTNLDSGCYEALAGILAKDFTVITYDRRGYSRSPGHPAWESTSIQEQADDAAALLSAIGIGPTAVFGSSSAGPIALELALRHPEQVRGVIAHEPGLFTVLPQAIVQEAFAGLTPMIEQAVATGGPAAGQQALLGALAGAGGFESLAGAEMRERWLSNAGFVFQMEFPNMLLGYQPDEVAIAATRVPIQVMRAEQSLPINIAASEWLASKTGTSLLECPGTHLAYCQRPAEVAEAIRPFLARAAASSG